MTWARQQTGRQGLARQEGSIGEGAWLQNLDWDRNGIARPRFGLKHVKTMSGTITDLSKLSGYNARLMVISNSGSLDNLHVETGVVTNVDTGWPTTPVAKCLSPQVSGSGLWIAHKSAIGGSVGPLKKYDGTTYGTITPSGGDGNYVGMHGYMVMRAASGETNTNALCWSNVGDPDTWATGNKKGPIPELGTIDAVVPYGPQQSLLLGPYGVGHVIGTSPTQLSFEPLVSMLLATPMRHVCKCRDRVIFLAAGPKVVSFSPPGIVRDISLPIYRDLFLATGVVNLRGWYDPIRNYYCLTDNTQHYTYCYSLDLERWVGVWQYTTTSSNILGGAVVDQGASGFDEATMPWGKGFVAVGSNVLQWDPSVATDATGSNTTAAFTCAVETPPLTIDGDPRALKAVREVQLEGAGNWSLTVKGRDTPDGSWTSHSISGTIAAGGVPRHIDPQVVPAYREIALRVEIASATTVRFKSLGFRLETVALP